MEDLDLKFSTLPNKKYDIIYADPPWQYSANSFSVKQKGSSKRVYDTGGASTHYPTMSHEELMAFDIPSIANKNCILFMWAVSPKLDQALELGETWGFNYREIGFVWNKKVTNPGYYTMSQCEMVLIFDKGNLHIPVVMPDQFQSIKRGDHSSKPDHIRHAIHSMYPDRTKIELFARDSFYPNWDYFGNQLEPDRLLLPLKMKES